MKVTMRRLTPDGWEITEQEQEETHGPDSRNSTDAGSNTPGSAASEPAGDAGRNDAAGNDSGSAAAGKSGDNGGTKPAGRTSGKRARHPR